MTTIGVIKEQMLNESRVALTPAVALELIKKGASIVLEKGAGLRAGFSDQEYEEKGVNILNNSALVLEQANIILAVNASVLAKAEVRAKIIIGLCSPFEQVEAMEAFRARGATVLALELIPRISRAQSMDVLSSQANLAGYVAVLLASARLNKVIPLMMTAAGTIKPAQFLVLGAGVAGLQAIASAKRLGALVHAYDVRTAVKEQVESLGAKFVNINLSESAEGSGGYAKALSEEAMREQRARLGAFAKDMDVIITTAQIPGQKAPRLLDEPIFHELKEGSVVIDMASKSGGNVPGSIPNEWQQVGKAWLYGGDELARLVPRDASFTFSKNVQALLDLTQLGKALDLEDEIVKNATICHENRWINESYALRVNKQ